MKESMPKITPDVDFPQIDRTKSEVYEGVQTFMWIESDELVDVQISTCNCWNSFSVPSTWVAPIVKLLVMGAGDVVKVGTIELLPYFKLYKDKLLSELIYFPSLLLYNLISDACTHQRCGLKELSYCPTYIQLVNPKVLVTTADIVITIWGIWFPNMWFIKFSAFIVWSDHPVYPYMNNTLCKKIYAAVSSIFTAAHHEHY